MFVGISVIEILLFNQKDEEDEEHGKSVKVEITGIAPVLQDFLHFFRCH